MIYKDPQSHCKRRSTKTYTYIHNSQYLKNCSQSNTLTSRSSILRGMTIRKRKKNTINLTRYRLKTYVQYISIYISQVSVMAKFCEFTKMRKSLHRNHYFIIGIFLGLFISFYIPQDIWELVQLEECHQEIAEKFDFEPHLNLINKPLTAKKPAKNIIRPRYYSSELGIREKIFIGVMTSPENIATQATAINRTVAHLVNKIKFFINADNVKTNYKLKNIVGFTDTRENLRPFHVIKYIADNYLDDYDYFLIMPDTVYVDARKLKTILYHMSIGFDVYLGSRLDSVYTDYDGQQRHQREGESNDDFQNMNDRNYCDLDAGILLSTSVIRKMRNNLDWCVRNGISNVHSINIGRCVKYSSKLPGCLESFQGIKQQVFHLKSNAKIFKDLNVLSKDERFLNASTVFPVGTTDDFYRLHAFFSKHHLELAQKENDELEQKSYRIANGTISNNILENRWPLGLPPPSMPEIRHDIIVWNLINGSHIFLHNSENVVEPLSRIAALDIEKVLDSTLRYAAQKYPKLEFINVHTIYKRFDPTRGMDYQLHLNFREHGQPTQSPIVKSFEVVKPLGRVEVVPSPYVTESTRISMLIPVFEHQKREAFEFISYYERICMRNQDNTFLLMIFLYRFESSSKGDTDPFKDVKNLALELSTKYKLDGSRIAWVSIRLPSSLNDPTLPDDIMLNSLYGRHEILSIAVADLALPKIGLDSLVLMGSTSVTFKTDFLNRVRMNTIQGFQIYSPIGFMMYPCKFAYFCKECENCDVSQGTGYFDKQNFDIISFYSRDYVQARKILEHSLPITHTDNDIEQLLTRSTKKINTILDMFIISQLRIHLLRGIEPNLRYGNAIRNYIETAKTIPKCPASDFMDSDHEIPNRYSNVKSRDSDDFISNQKCIHLASKKQLGDAIIRFEDKSIVHK